MAQDLLIDQLPQTSDFDENDLLFLSHDGGAYAARAELFKGPQGEAGATYTPEVGTVETLPPGSEATVSVETDEDTYIATFHFGIPQGETDYTLPIAASNVLGGVRPTDKTGAMTQAVGVDAAGALWTEPGGSNITVDTTLDSSSTNPVQNKVIKDALDKHYVTAGLSGKLGERATAEGYDNMAMGAYCHAEGKITVVSGECAHGEGMNTAASGRWSHAEGFQTTAKGDESHAEGYQTYANGNASHAEGLNTKANGRSQHVFGEYNVPDLPEGSSNAPAGQRNTYVEVVGNGDATAPSNARTLDWSGNEWLAGKLTLGNPGTGTNDAVTHGQLDSRLAEALEGLPTGSEITVDAALDSASENPVQNKAVKAALDGKQDALTFDAAPTPGSANPVTSGGVYAAIRNAGGGDGAEAALGLKLASLEAKTDAALDTAEGHIGETKSSVSRNSEAIDALNPPIRPAALAQKRQDISQWKANARYGMELTAAAKEQLQAILDACMGMNARAKQATGEGMTLAERAALQEELDALRDGLNRAASTASYDGRKLLDGSLCSGATVYATETTGVSEEGKYFTAVDISNARFTGSGGVIGGENNNRLGKLDLQIARLDVNGAWTTESVTNGNLMGAQLVLHCDYPEKTGVMGTYYGYVTGDKEAGDSITLSTDPTGTGQGGNALRLTLGQDITFSAEGPVMFGRMEADEVWPDTNNTIKFGGDYKVATTLRTGAALTLQVGGDTDSFNRLTVALDNMRAPQLGLGGVDIGTLPGALAALEKTTAAVGKVSEALGYLRQMEGAFEAAYNSLVRSEAALPPPASGPLVTFDSAAAGNPVNPLLVHIEPVQDLHGYDHPWPGGGGKNLFSGFVDGQRMGNNNGELVVQPDYAALSDYIPVEINSNSGNAYILSGLGNQTCMVGAYDSQKQFLGRTGNSQREFLRLNRDIFTSGNTASGDIAYIRVQSTTYDGIEDAHVQLEKGSEATDYEPYANICPITGWTGARVTVSPTQNAQDGTTYDISFPASAGTVYGGTLDVARGLLTVTDGNIASYAGEALPGEWISDRDVYSAGGTPAAGAQVVYKLASPLTYQLTPQEVTTLLGTNNIFADCGDVDVTYRAGDSPAVLTVQDVGVAGGAAAYTAVTREIETLLQIANGTYQGTDLTAKFPAETGDNPWAWIKARIQAGDFSGLAVGDYIPFKTSNNVSLQAQIAGINTYTGYGNTAVGNHIDFICRELWPTLHAVNKVNFNNGTEAVEFPWLASDLYHFINSLSGTVPNAAAVGGGAGVAVDYTADGIYYYLPQNLKNVIVEKRFWLSKRYSASGLLTEDNGCDWVDIGKLWVPDEVEVVGFPVWSGKNGYSVGGSAVQYPLFIGNAQNRCKLRNGSHTSWRLLSPNAGSSTYWSYVSSPGNIGNYGASSNSVATPVCFRIA